MEGPTLGQWVALSLLVAYATSTYLAEEEVTDNSQSQSGGHNNGTDKSSVPQKRHYGPFFKNDKDVQRYLKIFGRDMMIWSCRNTVQPYWNWQPITFIELYCEGIGHMKAVSWYHKGQRIESGGRYRNYIMPHYSYGRYYSRWIDFRLRIYNATRKDSGKYVFRLTSPSNFYEEHTIWVDISNRKRKRNYWYM